MNSLWGPPFLFSLCVQLPHSSPSLSLSLSSSRAAQMPWIRWNTKGGKETLLKNKGLPLGCHVLFWPNVHPPWFLLLSTCPAHKVNTVDPHYLTLSPSSSHATHNQCSFGALMSLGILIQLLYLLEKTPGVEMEVQSEAHQGKPHTERKLADREAATQESRAGGRNQGFHCYYSSAVCLLISCIFKIITLIYTPL